MKKVIIVLLIFICQKISAQKICGIVVDATSKKSIPYATISCDVNAVYADSTGRFEINIVPNDTLRITCVGYFDKILIAGNSTTCDTVFLNRNFIALKELRIGDYYWLKNTKLVEEGLKGKASYFNNAVAGVTLLKYFPKPVGGKNYIISEFQVKLRQASPNYENRKVRVRVFKAKNELEIGDDILGSPEVFIIEKPAAGFVSFNLNPFKIQVPEEGYFIGLEFLSPKIGSAGAGDLSVCGRVGKEFENGAVLFKYYTNDFLPYTFKTPSEKINLFFNTVLYEDDGF